MSNGFEQIQAVGFDLDGTLYAQSPAMDAKIAELFAEKMLAKRPELGTVENAKHYSEKRYRELESRKKTLEEAGYDDAGEIMEEIFRQADGAQFLVRDEKLISLLQEIRNVKPYLYIITTSPQEEAFKKFSALGIKTDMFNEIIMGDNPLLAQKPKNETVFKSVIASSGISAEQHVYVGDREKSDVLAPRSVGMKTIAVGTEIAAADISVPAIYDIKGILL
jgi:FMN phosphatase YigB (HAD superfamily)